MQTDHEQHRPEETPQTTSAVSGTFEQELIRAIYEKRSRGEIAGAATELESFITRFTSTQTDASLSALYVELGTLEFWLGDYVSAHRHGEKASALNADNDQALVLLGKVAISQYLFDDARRYFEQVKPTTAGKYLGFALLDIKLRHTDAARSNLAKASALVSRDNPEFVVLSAYVSLLEGSTSDAVRLAREKNSVCAKDPPLLLLIAEIMMTAGNYGEAVTLSQQVSIMCPKNDQVHAIQAHAAYAQEEYSSAESHALDALQHNPRNAYAKTVVMKCATRRGDYSYAEQLGSETVKEAPEYALMHANLGDVFFAQERYEMAKREYEATNDLMDSQTKGSLLRQARVAFMSESYADAVKILEKLISSNHTYYDDAMCDLLLCYDKLDEKEKMEDLMDKMELRKSFYHRTEQLLKEFDASVL